MSGPVWKAGPSEEAEGAQERGDRTHSYIIPAGRRISSLSASRVTISGWIRHSGNDSV